MEQTQLFHYCLKNISDYKIFTCKYKIISLHITLFLSIATNKKFSSNK